MIKSSNEKVATRALRGAKCMLVPLARNHLVSYKPRGQVSRGMVTAAIARQAAAVVHARALAALARAALVDDDEGDAFGCVRLLLTELAAALHVKARAGLSLLTS
jgi:hypothetical protein